MNNFFNSLNVFGKKAKQGTEAKSDLYDFEGARAKKFGTGNTWHIMLSNNQYDTQPNFIAELTPGNVLHINYAYSNRPVDKDSAEKIKDLINAKEGTNYFLPTNFG